MGCDVSFLLPTNRPKQYAERVINSINRISTDLTYRICLYSSEKINLPNVKWYEEKAPVGPIAAFNSMVEEEGSEYVILMVDDHEPQGDVYNSIDFLKSDVYKDRKYKVTTLAAGGACYLPTKGDLCGDVILDYNVPRYMVMRFPVAEIETIRNHMNNHIFHPGFHYHAGDLWLGYWLGSNGEPGIESNAHISGYIAMKDSSHEVKDCIYYNFLVDKHRREGYQPYV